MTSDQHDPPIANVLVSVDGSPSDRAAVGLACRMAHDTEARVFAIYVIEVQRSLPLDADLAGETARGEGVLADAAAQGRSLGCELETELLQAREVGPAIVDEACERSADVVVMGIGYKRRFGEFTMGETVPYVLKNAPCRVCISRQPEHE